MTDDDTDSDDSLLRRLLDREKFTAFGRTIRPRNLFTPEDDPTVGPVSFLSSVPEKHAIALGFIVALAVLVPAVLGLELWMVGALVFGSAAAARKAVKRGLETSHAKDAIDELAYTGAGAACAIILTLAIAAIALVIGRDPAFVAEQFIEFLRLAFTPA